MSSIGRKIKIPAIQDLPANMDADLRVVLEEIIYALDLREGRVAPGTNSRFVTIQDLVDAEVVDDGKIT